MSQETTYAGMIGEWQKLIATLETNAADLPHAEVPKNELAAMLARAQGISLEQAALTATKQEKSKQIQTLLADGNRLVTGMRKMIADRYGVRAEKLTEFGIPPFRGRTRKVKPGTEPENPEVPSPAQKS